MKHLLLTAALAAGAAPVWAGTLPARTAVVTIDDFKFVPSTITVDAGTTLRFVNHDQEAHTVTSRTNLFNSAGLDTGAVWMHRFTKPGKYAYYCELHPYMKGTIVVVSRKQGSP